MNVMAYILALKVRHESRPEGRAARRKPSVHSRCCRTVLIVFSWQVRRKAAVERLGLETLVRHITAIVGRAHQRRTQRAYVHIQQMLS